jgi:uncharacterized membrane protein HdeD (DUF308 family)
MALEPSSSNDTGEPAQELSRFRKHWWWFTVLGVLTMLCGIVAIAYPLISSVSVVIVIAATLIISGLAMVVTSFWTGNWSAFLLQVLVGILYVTLGMLMTDAPLESTAALTLFVAGMLMIVGIFRIVAALTLRFPQWGWALVNGIVTLMLGLIIYRHFPESALWVIGVFVGVELLMNGLTWIMLGWEVRNLRIASGDGVTVVTSGT